MSPVPSITPNAKRTLKRVNHAMGPIFAGMVIDAVDFVTFGPVGLILGIPVGAAAGYWLGRSMHLEQRTSVFCAIAAGIYCTIPGTELLPLGTLVGALVRFEDVPSDNADSATDLTPQPETEDVEGNLPETSKTPLV